MTTNGYLHGQTSLSTSQKINDLRASDQATSGLNTSVISPGEGQAQNLPNPNTSYIFGAQPLPQFTEAQPKKDKASPATTTTVNLGANGTLSTVSATRFEIHYTNAEGVKQVYYFSLPPAIDTNLRSSTVGATVPEVKPGILVRTTMNYKRFLLPGGAPAYQSLGVEQTMIQLVGLFVGVEGETYTSPDQVLYGRFSDTLKLSSAYQAAQRFVEQVVQSGREVELFVQSDSAQGSAPVIISYQCILRSMRLFVTRYDRVYYALDAEVTQFKANRPASIGNTIRSIGNTVSTIVRSSNVPQSNPTKP